ncbi:MAG: bifunctional 5,10-methylene-tetrahydrofolate dehydrogenase/5,10-methylene-tetrahydrofolate cyclohydrolase [Bacteroidales bacterium]|nr:bifunctional 5,10-methylene-tetrahydrofolate dehydrogenase/5,10-methylene-tetrahydrofolate cyclohydrolase [Bacteroidales bacterium]
MVILDGKVTSDKIKQEIAQMVKERVANGGKRPHLVAILVGNDGASQTYVANKERACAQVGFNSTLHRFPAEITQDELIKKIEIINQNDDVDGLIVQLPLPAHIDEDAVINAIHPSKDVDGFHPENVGKMTLGLPTFVPATPYGILRLLEEYGVETSGKHCVIIGRSNIVGRPLANLMSLKDNPGDCTVTVCHSHTKNIENFTKQADIIIAALGSPGFVKGDMINDGTVIVDVGITRISDPTKKSGYRLEGDVDFESCAPKASFITPVPGGVGPMTIVSLMVNTLKAAEGK